MDPIRLLLFALMSWGLTHGELNTPQGVEELNNTTTTTFKDPQKVQTVNGWKAISGPLFNYTGIYISDDSVLAPLAWLGYMMKGLYLAAMGSSERMDEGFTNDLCDITCSAGLVRVLALVGCGGSALGLLENSIILNFISSNMICPVSKRN